MKIQKITVLHKIYQSINRLIILECDSFLLEEYANRGVVDSAHFKLHDVLRPLAKLSGIRYYTFSITMPS